MSLRLSDAKITRPANTTAYTAGDVITGTTAAVLEFATDTLHGHIHSCVLIDSTAETLKPECDLMLFDAAPTIAADNAACSVTDAEAEHLVGMVPLLAANFKTCGANGAIEAANVALNGLTFVSPDRKLYGILIARNSYVPISGEVFKIRLGVNGA